MKTQLLIPISIVMVSLGILFWQRGEIKKIREEIAETKTGISRQNDVSSEGAELSGFPENGGASTREEKIRVTVDQLLNLPSSAEEAESMADVIRALGEVLEFLKDHSDEDLFLILTELKDREDEDPEAGDSLEILLMLLADVEPERAIAFVDEHFPEDSSESQQLKMVAFSALAEAEPEKAIALLETQVLEDKNIRLMAELKILKNLAGKDLEKAFSYFDSIEIHPANRSVIIAQATRDPERREDAWELLAGDLDPKLRIDLNQGLLSTICMESGLEGVGEVLPRLKFSNSEERDQTLMGLVDLGILSKPKETMTWIQDEISPERHEKVIPESLRKWATRDFESAGNWLCEQEASPVKNSAIASYATTIARLNPQAALEWASEISEEKSQNQARREVLKQWHQTNSKEAEEWLKDQGLDPGDWLPAGRDHLDSGN